MKAPLTNRLDRLQAQQQDTKYQLRRLGTASPIIWNSQGAFLFAKLDIHPNDVIAKSIAIAWSILDEQAGKRSLLQVARQILEEEDSAIFTHNIEAFVTASHEDMAVRYMLRICNRIAAPVRDRGIHNIDLDVLEWDMKHLTNSLDTARAARISNKLAQQWIIKPST
jgi:hypothetical protein